MRKNRIINIVLGVVVLACFLGVARLETVRLQMLESQQMSIYG